MQNEAELPSKWDLDELAEMQVIEDMDLLKTEMMEQKKADFA